MFCFQCQQAAKNTACVAVGVCGKSPSVADLQDATINKCVALARAIAGKNDDSAVSLIIDSLFLTVTNVNFSANDINKYNDALDSKLKQYNATENCDVQTIWDANEDIRSLKSLILFGIKGVAAYAHHAATLGYRNPEVDNFIVKAMAELCDDQDVPTLLNTVLETGKINLECMALLDRANTETYGNPVPTTVTANIEKGPFIVISGHDLHDLQLLLEQTKDKGVNIYTHGEMLPCHAYPELKKHSHLKGNFGTAWQNQQKEFIDMPGAVLFTTNCIMPVKENYKDRVFTTSVVGFDGVTHIGADKDFTPVINKALELGGYKEDKAMSGINGGSTYTVGFGHNTVLSVADTVVEAVKSGGLKHIFLVGGCDGAAVGRNYYTEFVKNTPADTAVLTLACGKFRFNDLDLGTVGGLPRIMDMGQCNDAYSAIKVAAALSEVFNCGLNDLPLTLVLSWYEQKAVCILLTLLYLGMKNIYLGPTLPPFVSPGVLNVLVEKFNIKPTGNAMDDMNAALAK